MQAESAARCTQRKAFGIYAKQKSLYDSKSANTQLYFRNFNLSSRNIKNVIKYPFIGDKYKSTKPTTL